MVHSSAYGCRSHTDREEPNITFYSVFVNESNTKTQSWPIYLVWKNTPSITPKSITQNNFEGNQIISFSPNNLQIDSNKSNIMDQSNDNSIKLRNSVKQTFSDTPKNVNKGKETLKYSNPFDYSYILTAKGPISKRVLKKKEKEDKSNSWMCVICAQEYQEKNELLDHYGMHKRLSDQLEDNDANTDQCDLLICPVCEDSFKNIYAFKRHILIKHKPKENTCSICDKDCESDYDLSVHLAQHNSDKTSLVCNVCKSFSTSWASDLAAHINKNHFKRTFFCEECGDNFTSETWFNGHKIFHFKSGSGISCDKCSKPFASQRLMIKHMKKMHNIKAKPKITKFKCFKCDLTFPQESNLKAHTRDVHAKRNSFLCNVCGIAFQFQAPLTVHLKNHREGTYVCSTCGKKFKQNTALTIHSRIHSGEKPNKCKICDKSYSQKSTLNVHMRTHTGERPYPCSRCTKGFITKTIRDIHQKKCKK